MAQAAPDAAAKYEVGSDRCWGERSLRGDPHAQSGPRTTRGERVPVPDGACASLQGAALRTGIVETPTPLTEVMIAALITAQPLLGRLRASTSPAGSRR